MAHTVLLKLSLILFPIMKALLIREILMNGNTLSFPRCPGWSGPNIPEWLLICFWFPGSTGNKRKIITWRQVKTFIFQLAIFFCEHKKRVSEYSFSKGWQTTNLVPSFCRQRTRGSEKEPLLDVYLPCAKAFFSWHLWVILIPFYK